MTFDVPCVSCVHEILCRAHEIQLVPCMSLRGLRRLMYFGRLLVFYAPGRSPGSPYPGLSLTYLYRIIGALRHLDRSVNVSMVMAMRKNGGALCEI